MNAIGEYLNSEKYQPEIYDGDGWKLLEDARAELAQRDAAIAAAVAEAVAAERERCAKMIEDAALIDASYNVQGVCYTVAAAIRNGSASK